MQKYTMPYARRKRPVDLVRLHYIGDRGFRHRRPGRRPFIVRVFAIERVTLGVRQ